jgi:hypothetical protein
MAATNGSAFQALLVQHIAGSPPDCDPQRASESFNAYFIRMQGHALLPDIGASETDAAYLIRLRSYQPSVPVSYITASYATFATTATAATTAVSASFATSASYAP